MNLRMALDTLENSGLIQLEQVEPEPEYAFRHSLVQDAVYASLLKSDQRSLHRAAGIALEALSSPENDRLAPVLASHFLRGGSPEKALEYFSRAGEAASRIFAVDEAALYFQQAIQLARQASGLSDHEHLIHLYSAFGRVQELMSRFDLARKTYEEMEVLAAELNDQKMMLTALISQATLYTTPNFGTNPERGSELSLRAIDLARQLGDLQSEARIHWQMILQNFYLNKPDEARHAAETALQLSRKLGMLELTGFVLNDVTDFVYLPNGELTSGLESCTEACSIWEQTGNKAMLANSLTVKGHVFTLMGNFSQANVHLHESLQISKEIRNHWGRSYSSGILSISLSETGELDQAFPLIEETLHSSYESQFAAAIAIGLSQKSYLFSSLGAANQAEAPARESVELCRTNLPFWLPQAEGALALAVLKMGDLETAQSLIANVYDSLGGDNHNLTFENILINAYFELLLQQHRFSEAVALADRLLPRLYAGKIGMLLPYVLFYRGLASISLEDLDSAKTNLLAAIDLGRTNPSRLVLWRALAHITNLNNRLGDLQAGDTARNQGLIELNELARRCPSDELRLALLKLPEAEILRGKPA